MSLRRRHQSLLAPAVTASLACAFAAAGIASAPQAAADCVSAGASTICGQGSVTGGGAVAPPVGGTSPAACALDYLCDSPTRANAGRPIYPKIKKGPSD